MGVAFSGYQIANIREQIGYSAAPEPVSPRVVGDDRQGDLWSACPFEHQPASCTVGILDH